MPSLIRVTLVLVLLAYGALGAIAFAQQTAPRDVATTRPFTVSGRVVSDDLGAPLRRVRITVRGDEGVEPLFTDDLGRFQILMPAASEGSLRITKSGFAPLYANRLSAVSAGTDLVLRMIKGASISGLVLDRLGVPAVGVRVRVQRIATNTAQPEGGPAQFATDTDDLGEFRVGNLPAGRYAVSAGGPQGGRGGGRGGPPEPGARGGRGRGATAETVAAGGQGTSTPTEIGAAGARGRGVAPDAAVQAGRGRGGRGGRGAEAISDDASMVDLGPGQAAMIPVVFEPPATSVPPGAAVQPQQSAATATRAGVVRGRVFAPDTTPLKGANVQLSSLDGGGASRSAVSDANGRFEITGVAAGRFRMRASKTGFTPVEYGQSRAMQQGRTITVAEGQRVQGIDVTMPRGSVITGALVDPWGEPVEGATMQIWQARFADGRTTVRPATNVLSRRTDDRGYYRLYGLLPGTYYVVAADAGGDRPRGRGPGENEGARVFYPGTGIIGEATTVQLDVGQDASGVDMVFSPARPAQIRGRALDSVGQPASGRAVLGISQRSRMVALPVQNTNVAADGSFEFDNVPPGDYVVQVISGGTGPFGDGRGGARGGGGGRGGAQGRVGGQGQAATAAAGRGPGPGAGQAGATGQQTTNGNAGGRGRGGQGTAAPAGIAGLGTTGQGGGGGGRAGGAGGGGRGGRGAGGGQPRLNGQGPAREFGTQFVTVAEGEFASVSIAMAPGARMTGEILLEGDAASVQPSSFGLTSNPADLDTSPIGGVRSVRAVIQDDWRFEASDIFGAVRFASARAPEGWWLKSVNVGGVNAVEDPALLDRTNGSNDGVTVVFADGAGEISGRVVDDRKQPISQFSVVVFSSNPNQWFSQSPYLTLATSSQDGTFVATGLAPSEYYAVAVDRIDGGSDFGDWQNPDVLSVLASSARRVTVGRGQRISAELRLIQMPR